MVRTFLKYSFGAIALYLLVNYASGSGTVMREGAAGGATLVKAFQGR